MIKINTPDKLHLTNEYQSIVESGLFQMFFKTISRKYDEVQDLFKHDNLLYNLAEFVAQEVIDTREFSLETIKSWMFRFEWFERIGFNYVLDKTTIKRAKEVKQILKDSSPDDPKPLLKEVLKSYYIDMIVQLNGSYGILRNNGESLKEMVDIYNLVPVTLKNYPGVFGSIVTDNRYKLEDMFYTSRFVEDVLSHFIEIDDNLSWKETLKLTTQKLLNSIIFSEPTQKYINRLNFITLLHFTKYTATPLWRKIIHLLKEYRDFYSKHEKSVYKYLEKTASEPITEMDTNSTALSEFLVSDGKILPLYAFVLEDSIEFILNKVKVFSKDEYEGDDNLTMKLFCVEHTKLNSTLDDKLKNKIRENFKNKI